MDEINRYSPRAFAQRIGVSVKTLQRWDRLGILIAGRTLTNRRVYSDDHLRQVLSRRNEGNHRD